MKKSPLVLRLKGKTAVFIDWANVYGWRKSLKKEVDPEKVYKHQKSKSFLQKVKKIGYRLITKPVKYILIAEVEGQKLYRRKCDFDMEACIDVHELLKENYESFIFFTGDGDFEPLYRLLIELKKQVIVIYAHGHLGREIWGMKHGIFKKAVNKLGVDLF